MQHMVAYNTAPCDGKSQFVCQLKSIQRQYHAATCELRPPNLLCPDLNTNTFVDTL